MVFTSAVQTYTRLACTLNCQVDLLVTMQPGADYRYAYKVPVEGAQTLASTTSVPAF